MAGLKKRAIIISVVCAVVISGAIVSYLFIKHRKKDNKQPHATLQSVVDQLAQNDKDSLFNTKDLKSLSDAFDSKQYDTAITIAKKLCPTLTDSSSFTCNGVYAQALAKKGEFRVLETLATEVLKNVKVQKDDTLRISWTVILDSAKKDTDPASAKPMSDIEARQ